jgi:hypothetical protein
MLQVDGVDQAGYGPGRRHEHAIADMTRPRNDRPQPQAWIQQGVVGLTDGIGHTFIGEGARGDTHRHERLAIALRYWPVLPGCTMFIAPEDRTGGVTVFGLGTCILGVMCRKARNVNRDAMPPGTNGVLLVVRVW